VLPPSIRTSPGASAAASDPTACSVGSPAGTITHTVRGGVSAATNASIESAPVAPSDASAATASEERSCTTQG
jgi:hypothetical protein